MKQDISALMDGELFEDEAEDLLDRVKWNPDAHKDWAVYHLIGDVLRQPEHIHCDLSAKVYERMQDEPTVLVPRSRAVKQKLRAVALSAVASLVAVGVVAWMSLQISPEAAPQMAMQQPALRPASAQIQLKSNDYLMAHQEFSPSIDMSGGAPYIRTVAYIPDEK
ncbi:MAG TPA: sigma-E factor negative regulatory protein [Gallionella sp.]|nr:sigma-E factor negative regulatory protein [Gallionella sp.]